MIVSRVKEPGKKKKKKTVDIVLASQFKVLGSVLFFSVTCSFKIIDGFVMRKSPKLYTRGLQSRAKTCFPVREVIVPH